MNSFSTGCGSVLVIQNGRGLTVRLYKDGRRSVSINGLRQCFGKKRQPIIDSVLSEFKLSRG